MVPKTKRLTKQDFSGQRPKVFFRGTVCDVAYIQGNEVKYACVISKKTIKKAVLRSKIRRRVYSVLERVQPSKIGHFLIYPKSTCLTSSYEQLQYQLMQAFATLQ